MRIARAASSFSLLLVLVFAGAAQDYGRAADEVRAGNLDRAQDLLGTVDEELRRDFQDAQRREGADRKQAIDRLVAALELRQGFSTRPSNAADPNAQAKQILQSPLYRDPAERQVGNWFARALERLGNLFRFRPNVREPNITPPTVSLSPFIVLAWVLLGAAAVAFAVFAIRHFRWRRSLARKAKAVLEEDEPERTLDEWLALADELTAQGKHREAVRALYLACLLKFDERNVARFLRGETNWEHLARIEASPRMPAGLEFRPATQHFDRVWYGRHVRGIEDVDAFRTVYTRVRDALEARAA